MKRDFSIFTGLLKTAREDDALVLTGIASSTVKDRHGDTMTRSALESMLRTADGMTIYLNHSYNVPEDVAGTVRRAWIDRASDDLHDLHFEIAINEENPRAVQAFNAIDKGTKLGLSIGAMIPEGGAKRDKKSGAFVIDEVELLETSIVSIPANPRSWVEYARKSLMTKSDIPEVEVEEAEMPEGVDDDPTVQHEPVVVEQAADVPVTKSEDEVEEEHAADDTADDACGADCCCGGTGPVGMCPDCTCAVDPDLTKAKVTVWPSGKVSVDTNPPATASSQDADLAQPENEEQDAEDPVAAALSAMTLGLAPEVQNLFEPTVLASLQTSRDLMTALVDTCTKAIERAERAERERDEALVAVKNLTETTEAFIARVAAYPRGRRAIAKESPEVSRTIESLRDTGMFSDTMIDILQKGVNS